MNRDSLVEFKRSVSEIVAFAPAAVPGVLIVALLRFVSMSTGMTCPSKFFGGESE